MLAIRTMFHGQTSHRPARISASIKSNPSATITTAWVSDYTDEHPDESQLDKHFRAVKELCKQTGWKGALVAGYFDSGYVWVFTDTPAGGQVKVWEVGLE